MRQRSNLIILFGIAFLLVGGAIVYLIVDDDGGDDFAVGVTKVSVLVAKDTIPANTVGADAIEAGLVEIDQVAAGSQAADVLSSAAALENRIFAVEVSKGSPISTSQLVTRSLSNIQVPEGFDAVAVQVSYTGGGAGYIAPGDKVNVYGIYGDQQNTTDAGVSIPDGATADVPSTELALTNVLVLDVSAQQPTSATAQATTTETGAQVTDRNVGSLTYLLALKPEDVERVVQIRSFADLYLSLTADDAPNAPDTPGSDGSTVDGPVSTSSAAKPAA